MSPNILFWVFIVIICLHCSGCATILGGIIGYQSAELGAGLAIGAAIDFGDDIARGIGQMTTKKEDFCKIYNQQTDLDAKAGRIELPITPFNRERVTTMISTLEQTFEKNGLSREIQEKVVRNSWFSSQLYQKWHCTAPDQKTFDLEIRFHNDRDTTFLILNCPDEERTRITSQIYEWMKEGLCSP